MVFARRLLALSEGFRRRLNPTCWVSPKAQPYVLGFAEGSALSEGAHTKRSKEGANRI
jgi:hypothetical protein